MKLLILGGGNNQRRAIIRAVEKGHEVVLTDYYKNAPGRIHATYNEVVSTFDVQANIEVGKKYSVDGVMTLGTDQPVYTAARVAHALHLPTFLDVATAEAVTNKKIMKTLLTKHGIPTVHYKFIGEDFQEEACKDMTFPVVLKPLDSQGQRGIYKLHTPQEVKENIKNTLSFSRQDQALLEEYYESDEITISAWVQKGTAHILTITDRETFQRDKHIGICFSHYFPSKHIHQYETIERMIQDITRAFGIDNGPLYAQLLVGDKGIFVNEIACRIGGAYEDIFIPYLTNMDILDWVIDSSLGKEIPLLNPSYCVLENKKYLSSQLFFAKPGKVKSLTPVEELKKLPGVIHGGYNISQGVEIPVIKNATARAGYLIITGTSPSQLHWNINNAFHHLKILDNRDNNLAIQYKIY